MMRENFGRCIGHGVKFSRVSKDNEENFPGAVNVEQHYCITDENEVYMVMKASLAPGQAAETMTPYNQCNHAYWNLSGDFSEATVAEHSLSLPTCDRLIELGEGLMPTGNLPEVKNDKRFDFTDGFSKVGDRERLTGAIDGGGQPGIDHPFALTGADLDATNPKKLHVAAHLRGGSTQMSVYTTQPALVVYTGNFLPQVKDSKHRQHGAICLETCSFNDAVNMKGREGWPKKGGVIGMGDEY